MPVMLRLKKQSGAANNGVQEESLQAQSLIEYTTVIAVIVAIGFAMTPFLLRGTQGMIRTVADQVGIQERGDQVFNSQGVMESAYTSVRAVSDQKREDALNVFRGEFVSLDINYSVVTEFVEIYSNALINMGSFKK